MNAKTTEGVARDQFKNADQAKGNPFATQAQHPRDDTGIARIDNVPDNSHQDAELHCCG